MSEQAAHTTEEYRDCWRRELGKGCPPCDAYVEQLEARVVAQDAAMRAQFDSRTPEEAAEVTEWRWITTGGYERLHARVETMEGALRFYGTRANWIPGFKPGEEGRGDFRSAIERDGGQRARVALAAAPSEGGQEAHRA